MHRQRGPRHFMWISLGRANCSRMSKQSVSVDRCSKRLARDCSGASALEFAILAPIFLSLVFGVIVLGWALYTMSNVNFVAERVGRLVQLNPAMSATEVSESIKAELPHLDQDNLNVSLQIDTQASGYTIARATVTYDFSVEVPLLWSQAVHYTTTVSVPLT